MDWVASVNVVASPRQQDLRNLVNDRDALVVVFCYGKKQQGGNAATWSSGIRHVEGRQPRSVVRAVRREGPFVSLPCFVHTFTKVVNRTISLSMHVRSLERRSRPVASTRFCDAPPTPEASHAVRAPAKSSGGRWEGGYEPPVGQRPKRALNRLHDAGVGSTDAGPMEIRCHIR